MRHHTLLAVSLVVLGALSGAAHADVYGIRVVSITTGQSANPYLADTSVLVRLDDGTYGIILADTASDDYFVARYPADHMFESHYEDAMRLLNTAYSTGSRLVVRTTVVRGYQYLNTDSYVRMGW